MCRLFGAVSRGPVYYDLFEEFADLAVTGNTPLGGPDERGHRDGWGITMFRNGELMTNAHGATSPQADPNYYKAAWSVAKTNIDRKAGERIVVLGHLRRASKDMPVGSAWSHPFLETRGESTWAFAQNGGLHAFPYREEQGLTDSQLLFRILLENLRGDSPDDVAAALQATTHVANREYGGYSAMNLLLTDGRSLHAYRDYASHADYYSLHYDDFGEAALVCSQPILGMKDDPIVKGHLLTIGPNLTITKTYVAP